MSKALTLWMNGEFVGTWTHGRTHVLAYAPGWLANPKGRPLSRSLPLTVGLEHRGPVVENYFDNLLPDADAIRRRIRTRFGTRSSSAFDLLAAIGRDCVGALQLLPDGETLGDVLRIDGEPMSESQIARLLRSQRTTSTLGRDDTTDFRISIAGAQEKTALLHVDGAWYRPMGSTPTTHIMKLPLGRMTQYDADFTSSVDNEWLCAQFARVFGLDVADTSIATFEDMRVLAVERFDREWREGPEGPHLIRIPQEDLCQALGVSPFRKYEPDGGPGMEDCLNVMATTKDPRDAVLSFVLTQVLFFLLAAPDGHAKNFSIFIEGGGAYSPTPLYDILSAWPVIGRGAHQVPYQRAGLAMAVRAKNAHHKFSEIQARHWEALSLRWGGDELWEIVQAAVAHIDGVITEVERTLPKDFPPQVWDTVTAGIRRHAKVFASGSKT